MQPSDVVTNRPPRSSLGRRSWSPFNHADLALAALLALNALFNASDLLTSFAALGNGLREGNSIALGLAWATGLETLGALVLLKAVFLAFAVCVFLLGVTAKSRQVKVLAFDSLLTSTVVFLAVSMNNLYWIFH